MRFREMLPTVGVSAERYTMGASSIERSGPLAGKQVICLSLLGNFAQYHKDWDNDGMWSAATTMSTLLVQLQSAGALQTAPFRVRGGRSPVFYAILVPAHLYFSHFSLRTPVFYAMRDARASASALRPAPASLSADVQADRILRRQGGCALGLVD